MNKLNKYVYAQLNTSFQQIYFSHEKPDITGNLIEMSTERPAGNWYAKADGKWHPGDPVKEEQFIDSEMQFIAEQLLKYEDNDSSAIATEKAWRDYRIALRLWGWGDKNYPNPDFRPSRPN